MHNSIPNNALLTLQSDNLTVFIIVFFTDSLVFVSVSTDWSVRVIPLQSTSDQQERAHERAGCYHHEINWGRSTHAPADTLRCHMDTPLSWYVGVGVALRGFFSLSVKMVLPVSHDGTAHSSDWLKVCREP